MLIGVVGLLGAFGWFYMTCKCPRIQSTAEKVQDKVKFKLDQYVSIFI